MKVKVSQTIDIDEVPAFVRALVSDCRKLLSQNAECMQVKMYDVPNMVQAFEKNLESINLIEAKLQDAINIAVGWAQTTQDTQEIPKVSEVTAPPNLESAETENE